MRPFMAMALVGAFLAACPRAARAWGPEGHMEVAAIAWSEMSPARRQAAYDILMNLPHKEQSIERGIPASVSKDNRMMYTFMLAATWPDLIRSADDPEHAQHRPQWHFINFPFDLDGQSGPMPPLTLPPQATFATQELNAVQALKLSVATLKNKDATPAQRAVALCWVLHLVGDIHQPLHATSLYSKDFPARDYKAGDRGGNEFVVSDQGRRTPLHPLWDYLPGVSRVPAVAAKEAAHLLEQPKVYGREAFAKELAADAAHPDQRFENWARESFEIAKTVVYADGSIRGANRELLKDNPQLPIPALPASYNATARATAWRRIAVAGHRLADLLGELLPA